MAGGLSGWCLGSLRSDAQEGLPPDKHLSLEVDPAGDGRRPVAVIETPEKLPRCSRVPCRPEHQDRKGSHIDTNCSWCRRNARHRPPQEANQLRPCDLDTSRYAGEVTIIANCPAPTPRHGASPSVGCPRRGDERLADVQDARHDDARAVAVVTLSQTLSLGWPAQVNRPAGRIDTVGETAPARRGRRFLDRTERPRDRRQPRSRSRVRAPLRSARRARRRYGMGRGGRG